MAVERKAIEFLGSSLDDHLRFPVSARREAGYQLDKVQAGEEPDDWKPMGTVGSGVFEIRVRDAAGAFRVFYVAKLKDVVYVLHCFRKKTRQTEKSDIALGQARYRALMRREGTK
jgi:phage-related protein